jgi:bifunctional pyridoxal-dependent enzyme with beta-cystathionase and maltose regulon repressor activities
LLDFRGSGVDDSAKWLSDSAKIATSDCEGFGALGYARINFAARRVILAEALDRIEKALQDEHRL